MPFALRPQENVVYPLPYVETEAHPLIVTNQRIVQVSEAGERELATARVSFVGRLETKPFVALGVVLMFVALPFFVYAGYLISTVWGMESAPLWPPPFMSSMPSFMSPSSEPVDPNTPPPDVATPDASPAPGHDATEIDGPKEVLYARATAAGLGAFGLLFGWGGLKLLRRRRYFVLCRSDDNQLLKLQAPDKMLQTQIIMTVQSVSGR